MQSAVNDQEPDAFDTLLGTLTSKAVLRASDIQMLRHAFYEEGIIERRRAAAIFHANRLIQGAHVGWIAFYLEALTAFFLKSHHEYDAVDAEAENTLLVWLGEGVIIPNPGERQLTTRLLMRATNEPRRLEQRVLQAISENLLHEDARWIGEGKRIPGIVDAADIQLIRRLAYRSDKAQDRTIRKAIIPFLLRLDRQAERFADPDGWRRLLAACLARHLSQDLPADCDYDQLSRGSFSVETVV